MNRVRSLAFASLALGALTGSKAPPYAYGPAPDWSRYRELGTAAIKAILPDPDGWEIEWPNGYVAAGWSNRGHVDGYTTCATVRAIKPIEGSYPTHPVAVVIDHDQVKRVDFQPKPRDSRVNFICRHIVALGKLPPASLMHSGGGARATEIASLGVSVRPIAEGAYVTAVTAGSTSARSGLKPGMVVTSMNGVALAGMGDAMIKLLSSDTPSVKLDTATGQQFTLSR